MPVVKARKDNIPLENSSDGSDSDDISQSQNLDSIEYSRAMLICYRKRRRKMGAPAQPERESAAESPEAPIGYNDEEESAAALALPELHSRRMAELHREVARPTVRDVHRVVESYMYCERLPQIVLSAYHNLILTNALAFSPVLNPRRRRRTARQRSNAEANEMRPETELVTDTADAEHAPKTCDNHSNTTTTESPSTCSDSSPPDPRLLSLGLGAGELHTFLRHHFPRMRVDTVDVDPTVIELAPLLFDVKFCNHVKRFNGTLGRRESMSADLWKDELYHGLVLGNQCLSHIIEDDVGNFVTAMAEISLGLHGRDTDGQRSSRANLGSVEHSNHRFYYDIVIMDIYDATVLTWDGTPGQGFSNPLDTSLRGKDDRADMGIGGGRKVAEGSPVQPEVRVTVEELLQAIRTLTHPDHGIAVFHLHLDGSYHLILLAVQSQFLHVVVIPSSHNSNILVASVRERLRLGSTPLRHDYGHRPGGTTGSGEDERKVEEARLDELYATKGLCADPYGYAAAVYNFSRSHGYHELVAERHMY
eukprot:gene1534-1777_t